MLLTADLKHINLRYEGSEKTLYIMADKTKKAPIFMSILSSKFNSASL
jgi:hypothetical protein